MSTCSSQGDASEKLQLFIPVPWICSWRQDGITVIPASQNFKLILVPFLLFCQGHTSTYQMKVSHLEVWHPPGCDHWHSGSGSGWDGVNIALEVLCSALVSRRVLVTHHVLACCEQHPHSTKAVFATPPRASRNSIGIFHRNIPYHMTLCLAI